MASALWDDVITISSLKILAGGEKNACKVVSQEVGQKIIQSCFFFFFFLSLSFFLNLAAAPPGIYRLEVRSSVYFKHGFRLKLTMQVFYFL